MSEPLIKVDHLKKYFPVAKTKGKFVKAVDDVTFEVQRGEIVGIVGESGCGKSTMGRCLMKLIDITDGSLYFDGQDITHFTKKEMDAIRSKMQMIFQNPFSSFNPRHTIGKSLMDVARHYGQTKEEAEKKIHELVEEIGLDQVVLRRRPSELSGGQLQRLAIARALVAGPEFILADEAVSALDVSVQAQILNMLIDLRDKYNLTMVFISHELTVVEHISDHVIVMYLGAVVEKGTSEELFYNPMHPYTRALLAAKPKETPDDEVNHELLTGDIPSAMSIPEGCRFCTRCPQCIPGKCDAEVPELRHISGDHYAACHLIKT